MGRVLPLVALLILGAAGGLNAFSQPATSIAATNEIRIVELQGHAQVFAAGAKTGVDAQLYQPLHPFDRILTAPDSRVALRWSDQSIVPLSASSEVEILPPGKSDEQPGLHLVNGVLSFFHRDKPGQIRVITRGAVAGIEGTEFILAADDIGNTTLSVVDGKVRLGNEQATLLLTNGQQGVVEPGKAPARTPGFIANNLLQWCFYYPAVLDLDDLPLTGAEKNALSDSLAAYRSGDLLVALAQYPAGRTGISDNERVYHAALLLSVGEVDQTDALLDALSARDDRTTRLAGALRRLITAVKRQPVETASAPQLASEFLAASYVEQSRAIRETSLRNALALAQKAVALAPQSGFTWERVAELQFSFGQVDHAMKSLDRSLALAPRNAQALALKGFVFAARDQSKKAIASFDEAIAADSALGNAWLGRGLSRIRQGDKRGGREDLLVAAALEPQRAELRSYLGKAYANTGDYPHATRELALAKKLDPNDPTAWLYSALLNQQGSRINDAIRDLEKSEALNDNRSVYRSQLLLDEDDAVRRANLAGMYRDDGMLDLSLREAGRAVSTDYANYSAHLFLGNSYNQLRDPNWSNLRYESVANDEFFIANLLAPGSAGVLSSVISEPAYINLFDQNRVGVVSDTTYLSRGAWLQEGAQFGVYDNISYDFEAKYTTDPGQRPNNQEQHRDLQLTVKDQFTPHDSLFVSVEQDKINNGDENEYYTQSSAVRDFRFSETQEPDIYIGYHHEWGPGSHTIFLAARQVGYESASSTNAQQSYEVIFGGQPASLTTFANPELVGIDTEAYSTELQQIWETPNHTTVLGTGYQWGDVHYQNFEATANPSIFEIGFFGDPNNIANQHFSMGFSHFAAYGYHTWQILESLSLSAGLSYDYIDEPADVSETPFSRRELARGQFSPKAGFIYTPFSGTVIRAAYTRSLGSFAGEQSLRIEPTEMAGFNDDYRSLVPGSVAGDASGSRLDTYDLSLEQKFDTGTYLALSGEMLYSRLNDTAGSFVLDGDLISGTTNFPINTSGLNHREDYNEKSLAFTADQLLGKQWSVGMRYKLTDAQVTSKNAVVTAENQSLTSLLDTISLHANWNHPSGLFSSFGADWYHQHDSGFSSAAFGDDFWQLNAYAGCRFWHRRAEFTVGILNLTDQGYHLEPLNFYNELPHGRTLLARLLITF